MRKLKKRFGESFSEKYVSAWIINLIDFYQVGKKMGDSQVYETATLIMQEYYMLTLADINLVFTRAKKGFYGELYDRLDGAVILSWFRKYFDERCSEAESLSQREHERHVNPNGAPRSSENDRKARQKHSKDINLN